MAGNLINTLYPPIADTFMPAFVNTTNGYILFSLSPYNSPNDIVRIHISLVDQKTNRYVLEDEIEGTEEGIYISNGIMVRPFADLSYDENSGLYYCPIEREFLKKEYRPKSSDDDTSLVYFKTET